MDEKEKFLPFPDWKMYIYTPSRGEWNACLYYRNWVPVKGLADLGLAVGWVDKKQIHHDSDVHKRQALFAMLTSDILLGYGTPPDSGKPIMDTLSGMRPGMIAGKLIYPPSFVYDIDDNLDWVHPFNQTYAVYGIRAGDGTVLEPGNSVFTTTGQGKKLVLWQDGVTQGENGWIFDIERNLDFNKRLHAFARRTDGWTTPSPYLLKYLRENHQYKEGYVFPNSIIPEDWVTREFAPREKEIRILWQGGGSHMSDWYYLKPAVQYIAKKYPNVKFVIFGAIFDWIANAIPEAQIEKHEWVPYDGYRATRAMLDCDINLCVLRDDEFSRSKSAIKFYEGSIQGVPEATLAAKMPPYSNEIIDGETGLLYDVNGTPEQIAESFAANLEELIKNAELRRKLGDNAKKWVLDNRHYLKTVPGLYEYYHELRLRKAKERPYDPEADKLPPTPKKPRKVSRAKRKAKKVKR